jgi:hypothetical protein
MHGQITAPDLGDCEHRTFRSGKVMDRKGELVAEGKVSEEGNKGSVLAECASEEV